MILFSSFNQPIIFFLFMYLGLISGLFYRLVEKTIKRIDKKIKIRPKCSQNTVKDQVYSQTSFNTKKDKINTKNKPKKDKKNIAKTIKEKISYYFKKLIKKVLPFICIATFVFVIALSYYANLILNYGHLRFIYVAIWVGMFFVGKSLFNLLANYFVCFYNKVIKRMQKNGKKQR